MDFLALLIQYLTEGGTVAVIVFLFMAVVLLVWDRKRLSLELDRTTDLVYQAKDSEIKSIKEIIDRYHKGTLDLVQALNEIKVVLATIQNTR